MSYSPSYTINPPEQQSTTALKSSGIRQRTSPVGQTVPPSHSFRHSSSIDPLSEDASSISTIRAIVLTVSMLGVLCFSLLATMFNQRYQFFAFNGNMEDAAASCWQTALLFAIIAIIAIIPSVISFLSTRHKVNTIEKKHVLPGAYRR